MVVDAIQKLKNTLQPRFAQVSHSDGVVEVKNFIGSVRMSDGTVLEVEPKVPTDVTWPHSVVQLLREDTRISVTGSQRSRLSQSRNELTEVIAFEFARRLERALSKDGPLQVFERHHRSSRRLNGQLDISAYARSAWRDPVLFPLRRDELTVSNDFARGLSLVCHAFRNSVTDTALSTRLLRLESAVIPGHPLPEHLNPAAALRAIPAQWLAYRPAWDIASAVLRNRSIINDPGHPVGLEVAVEPWPLLETLLERSLHALERGSHGLKSLPKNRYPILRFGDDVAGVVEPDGVLQNAEGAIVATFEAKYTRPGAHPKEEHRYQALSTAAVLDSPLSVLVYPGAATAKIYDVQGFNGQPAQLATIGLDLYTYDQDFGAESRAGAIADLLDAATGLLPQTQPRF